MSDRLHILLVDDDDVDRLAIRRALSHADLSGTITDAKDVDSARTHLRTAAVDCMLLDLQLPGRTGLEFLRELRDAQNEVPIVMLTGHGDEETAVEIMKAGASDYVNKATLSPQRLHQSIRYAVRIHRAERESRRARLELSRYAVQLRMLADAATAANSKLSVDAVTHAIADRAREIVGTRVAVVRTVASGGVPEMHAVSLPSSREGLRDVPALGEPAIMAPLTNLKGDCFGMVHLSEKIEGTFSDTDQSILVQLAQVGSVAIGNAVLFEAEQAATRVRDDVMAIISHDLRNPLTTISMSASALLSSLQSQDSRKADVVLRIQRAAARMNRLISDLLDVARIDANILAVSPSPNALDALIEEAIDPFRPIAAETNITISKDPLPVDLPLVSADRDRVLQLLGNLIGNAIKFTPPEGRVALGAEAEGEAVKTYVTNTGLLIPPENIPHIFDRYWHATDKVRLSVGLGLFIAKGIAEGHGGRIWVESVGGAVRRGTARDAAPHDEPRTTIFFTLPQSRNR